MSFDEWFKTTKTTNIDAASHLGVSANYISMLRHDRAVPSNALVLKILYMTDGDVPVGFWFKNGIVKCCCHDCGKSFTDPMPSKYCNDCLPVPF